LPDKAFIPQLR